MYIRLWLFQILTVSFNAILHSFKTNEKIDILYFFLHSCIFLRTYYEISLKRNRTQFDLSIKSEIFICRAFVIF